MSAVLLRKRNYYQCMASFPHLMGVSQMSLSNIFVKQFKYDYNNKSLNTIITKNVLRNNTEKQVKDKEIDMDIEMKECINDITTPEEKKRFEVYNQLIISNAIHNEMYLNKLIKNQYFEYLKDQANSGAMIID